ncbi:IPTL-CTERM sorting domain-containing protein [Ottowia thiooxydans]|uniref:IPTL-CTERM sorting domain-containing protein n=1 Tax=Ottowia thiooxydans TaxID=219182 RepID=UPI00040618E1|nr:IPTL-CTERM sorting domain-containing protein [Ottowia thiooxydans]
MQTAGLMLLAAGFQTGAVAAWVPDATMLTPRAQHAGALLDDGSVAVFGGVNRNGFVLDAERLTSGTWASLGVMGINGNVTEAVTLGTGQVLVRTDASRQARLYDPVTNAWSDAGMQTVVRGLPSMTLLSDGRVLVAGGSNERSAELYDPVTRSWAATGSMATARRAHTAVLMRDGRVLVASGTQSSGQVPGAEIYDPLTGSWSLAAPPLVPRHYASMNLLADGRLLLAGGYTSGGVTGQSEVYDPAANTWTATGTLSFPRNGTMGSPLAHATVLVSGKVLIVGGADGARNAQKTAELYDPATGFWSNADVITVGRENGNAHLLPSGEVLLAGGYESNPATTFFGEAARYQPTVPLGPAAVLDALPLLQRRGQALTLTGSGFKGAGGTSTPQLHLQRVGNGNITLLSAASHTSTSFQSPALGVLPAGLYMARLIVDGVPSIAQMVRFTDPAGTPTGTAGDQQVEVRWTAPVDDRGNPPVGYEVTSSPASAGCTATAPALQCTVTGLTNGTDYRFTVRARHANGLGPESSMSSAIRPVPSLSAPNNPAAVAGNTTADVTWLAPDHDGGSAIIRYTVTAEQDGTGQCTTTGALGCTVTNLTNGTNYSFVIVANNGVTDSPVATTNGVVPQGTQTINFPQPSPQIVGESYTPQATATSGLAVSISVDSGVCTIATPGVVEFSAAGSCTLRATQTGDTAFVAAPPVVRTFDVVLPTQSIVVSSTPNPSLAGQEVTFTISVEPLAGAQANILAKAAPVPGGTVEISEGGTLLGSAPLVAGQATITTTQLTTPGSHLIVARYSGDDNYPEQRSAAFDQVVAGSTTVPVPTLSQWGLILLSLVVGGWAVARRRVLG